MSHEVPAGGRPAAGAADCLIRLRPAGDRLLVTRSPAGDPPAEPFPLPRLPLSALRWCAAAAARHWADRRACLAVLLLLDPPLRRWVPVLPPKACGRRAVRWAVADADAAGLPPHLLVAGSFQALGPGDVFAAHAAVPPFDGVHAVEQRPGGRRGRRSSYLFVRAGGGEAGLLADPASVLSDDVGAALREAASRLRVLPDH
ncbi:MAG TPA: hypothetical protein VF796_02910 [Humisphaera sp.]